MVQIDIKVTFSLITVLLLVLNSCRDESKSNKQRFNTFTQKTFEVDTSLMCRFRLDGIILCYTTITDLKKMGFQPIYMPKPYLEKDITEITKGSGQNWKYYLDKKKNIIFKTAEDNELITSIIIYDNFSGTLNGFLIKNLSKTKMKLIESHFKELRWGIRGNLDYWIYSDEEIDFYTKLITATPEYPFNKEIYGERSPSFAIINCFCSRIYGEQLIMKDTNACKPMYAPLEDNHLNYYFRKPKTDIISTITGIMSAFKIVPKEEIRIGKWVTYNPDHTIKSIKYYNHGQLVEVTKE
ncbi:MAG: hypothetical protein EAZ55_12915 [Cytophagales bacterium]|nr:MAG: hypothetical protein EAZ55_12915 [Cytophagales bacterium]